MRKRTSGTSGCGGLLVSQSVPRRLMVSRGPRWWIRPVYRPAARLLTNRKKAAARRHDFKLARDIPAAGDALDPRRRGKRTVRNPPEKTKQKGSTG